MIIDPRGVIITQASDLPTAIYADLDFALLDNIRARLPAPTHRRDDLLGS